MVLMLLYFFWWCRAAVAEEFDPLADAHLGSERDALKSGI